MERLGLEGTFKYHLVHALLHNSLDSSGTGTVASRFLLTLCYIDKQSTLYFINAVSCLYHTTVLVFCFKERLKFLTAAFSN